MEISRDVKRVLACASFIGLMLFMLFAFIQCATLSKFLKLKAASFPIKLVFLEETIAVNVPGHWPKNILEFPESGYPLFYPVWIARYTDMETGIKYEFAIHTEKKKIYVLLEHKVYPKEDDRIFYIFVDGVPIKVELQKVIDLFDRIISGESSLIRELHKGYCNGFPI